MNDQQYMLDQVTAESKGLTDFNETMKLPFHKYMILILWLCEVYEEEVAENDLHS